MGIADVMEFENISLGTKVEIYSQLKIKQMLNRNSSAGTAAPQSSKCSLIQRPAIILAMLLLAAVFSSCGPITKPTSPTKWVITKVESLDRVLSYYRAQKTDSTGLRAMDTWMVDSSGKFELGDTVCFGHSR